MADGRHHMASSAARLSPRAVSYSARSGRERDALPVKNGSGHDGDSLHALTARAQCQRKRGWRSDPIENHAVQPLFELREGDVRIECQLR
jgi:hypothetical protein